MFTFIKDSEATKVAEIDHAGNTIVGMFAGKNITTASFCILLGPRAGEDIRDQNLQFRFAVEGDLISGHPTGVEFATTMTTEEYHVIHGVLGRALLNGKDIKAE